VTPARDRLALAGVALSIAGLAISAYLTLAHYANAPLACVNTGAIDCNAVTTSSFSVVPGTQVPISLLGVLWFATNGVLFALAVARERRTVAIVQLAGAIAGVAVVLSLVYAEVTVIGRICEWCTLLHVLIVAIFLIALRRVQTST
jgi:uncharacterized membrane protein